jgi:hypothetical protein
VYCLIIGPVVALLWPCELVVLRTSHSMLSLHAFSHSDPCSIVVVQHRFNKQCLTVLGQSGGHIATVVSHHPLRCGEDYKFIGLLQKWSMVPCMQAVNCVFVLCIYSPQLCRSFIMSLWAVTDVNGAMVKWWLAGENRWYSRGTYYFDLESRTNSLGI